MICTIERFDHYGRGITRIDGKIAFVKNALPEEIVNIAIDNETPKYIEAHVIKYIETSPKRVKSKCPFYDSCGGCHLRHMSYEDTLNFKSEKIKNILDKYAELKISPIVVKNKNRDFYRNKIEIKVENGIYGFYKSGSHEIEEIDRCLNSEEAINTILRSTNLLGLQKGLITIKSNYNEEVIISIESEEEPQIDIERLREKVKLVGIIFNKKTIFGADHFIEIVNGMFFKETYNSFFQINRYINSELFKIVEEAVPTESIVADICSGVGTLSIVASKKAKRVYSLEIVEASIRDGLLNAKMNKCNNVEFMLGDAFNNLGKIQDKIDTIIIDPPRSGLNAQAIETILSIAPKSIIYTSCDPITLSRDLKVLKSKYSVDKFYLLDMFSYTYHVECVCILKSII